MDFHEPQPPHMPELRALLAHLSEDEQREAEARLWRYTKLVRSIYLERLADRNQGTPDSTKSAPDSTLPNT